MTDIKVWVTAPEERAQAHLLRHSLFCLGGCGEVLETCPAERPDAPHDEWDGSNTYLLLGALNGVPVAGCRVIPGPDMPSIDIVAKRSRTLPLDRTRCVEPSRVGLMSEHQGTADGGELVKALLGLITTTAAVTCRSPYGFLTIRPGLLTVLMRLLPIEFDEPFEYGGEDRGPRTDVPIPTWAVHARFHEIGAAVQWFQPQKVADRMFPGGFGWLDYSLVRPKSELAGIMSKNSRKFARHMADWRALHPK